MFGIFSSDLEKEIHIYDYSGYRITSLEEADGRKDAIFNTLFDLPSIQARCHKSSLQFAYNITVLPGAYSWYQKSENKNYRKCKHHVEPWDMIREHRKKSRDVLAQEIKDLEKDIDQLKAEVKKEKNDLKKQNFDERIKAERNKTEKNNLQTAFHKRMDDATFRLKKLRFEQHVRKKAVSIKAV